MQIYIQMNDLDNEPRFTKSIEANSTDAESDDCPCFLHATRVCESSTSLKALEIIRRCGNVLVSDDIVGQLVSSTKNPSG